jgi:hypothetical protein
MLKKSASEGWATWSSSCSRNAHDKNVLVRRAQSRINQATLEKQVGMEQMRSVGGLTGPSQGNVIEQAWKSHLESLAAAC